MDTERTGPGFARLVRIIGQLRGHCPWMGALTHESLVEYLLEESYELIEAIETGHTTAEDAAELKGELGDVLLQVLLHARLQEEQGSFAIADVVDGLADKMIRRNPHVFRPDGSLQDSFPATVDQIVRTWHDVKKVERPERSSPFDGIPAQLPALALAAKTLDRARRAGLDGPGPNAPDPDPEEELGQALFDLVRRGAEHGLDPERALRGAVRRFTHTAWRPAAPPAVTSPPDDLPPSDLG